MRRWEYVSGQFAGVAAVLALFTAALGLLLAGLLLGRGAQLGVEPLGLPVFLCACALQWLKITLVAAMTLLICSYAGTALFASCAGLLAAMVAHLRPFASEDGALVFVRVWPNRRRITGCSAWLVTGPPMCSFSGCSHSMFSSAANSRPATLALPLALLAAAAFLLRPLEHLLATLAAPAVTEQLVSLAGRGGILAVLDGMKSAVASGFWLRVNLA
ncbi:MAG: hypothetical protein EXS42_07210 [Lacunisphaera sp.]|nr:hypothetical protein [Lacunisphaera sp.]